MPFKGIRFLRVRQITVKKCRKFVGIINIAPYSVKRLAKVFKMGYNDVETPTCRAGYK